MAQEKPDTTRASLDQAAERVARADRILVTCHRGPDGDSLGSMIALASLLDARGKQVTLYNPDPIPRRLRWLPLVKHIARKLKPDARFELTVAVDCADVAQLGKSFPGPEVTGSVLVLDHHSSARPFGDLFVTDVTAASVGVLVARMADYLDWPLTADAALGIYVSVVSDTGSFCYPNTSAEVFSLAARLVAMGIDPWTVYEQLHERASLGRYRLISRALDGIELVAGGKVAVMTITREDVKRASATWEDTVELVNYTRSLDGVECGLLLTPAKYGGTRVSMRSKGRDIDAGAICEQFGGGGHRGAAGCVLPMELPQARKQIIATLAEALGVELEPDEPGS